MRGDLACERGLAGGFACERGLDGGFARTTGIDEAEGRAVAARRLEQLVEQLSVDAANVGSLRQETDADMLAENE